MLIYIFMGEYNCYAATNITIVAGQSQVAVGKTVSVKITVPDNAEVWTYLVSYSTEYLTLSSGTLDPMGFAGENSRTNTLIFTATKVGTATISVAGEGSVVINGQACNVSGSVSVKVVAVSNPTPKPTGGSTKPTPTPQKDTRSSNCSLASITLNEGTLSPAFDSSVTSYSVNLSSKTTSINVAATPSDTKAAITGTGDIAVQPGANTINVVVTAENGTTKTYTIAANVDEAPLVYTKFEDKSLGVVRNLKNVTIPAGFAETTATIEGQEVKAWTNATTGITLVYLVDEEENAAFYVFSPDKGAVLCKYISFQFNGQSYTFAGIDESLRQQEGLTYGKVDAFDNTIDGFTYNDESLSSYVVLYLMNGDNQYNYYTYDKTNQTLQLFSGAVISAKSMKDQKLALEQKLEREILIRNISLGVVLVSAAAAAVLVYKLNTKNKKIRRLRRRGEASDIQA
jgi:hypothetical protein